MIGGVHGLERIGSELALDFMKTLANRAKWDKSLSELLIKTSIHIIPAANPAGLALGTRSNGFGVDLMRNAPQSAKKGAPWLAGGHRLSQKLPWYRGKKNEPMQEESQALINFSVTLAKKSEALILVDCHSGYGFGDGLWFPYAKSSEASPIAGAMQGLSEALSEELPHHGYRFEPQWKQYRAHGDLWDHALDLATEQGVNPGAFCPITLEMGSWSWIKKSPRQLFSAEGFFNPLPAHRRTRTLRRHASLLDFLLRAVYAHEAVMGSNVHKKEELRSKALIKWWS